jgi:hypothetical protein
MVLFKRLYPLFKGLCLEDFVYDALFDSFNIEKVFPLVFSHKSY